MLCLILLPPYFIRMKGSIPPMAPNMLIPMPLMPLTNPLPTPWGNVRLTNSFLWQCSESNDSRSRFLETLEAKLVTLVKVPALTCLTKLDEPVVIPKMVRTQKFVKSRLLSDHESICWWPITNSSDVLTNFFPRILSQFEQLKKKTNFLLVQNRFLFQFAS